MVTYMKKALITLLMLGSIGAYASGENDNRKSKRNVVTGRDNVVVYYGNVMDGTIITNGRIITHGNDTIIQCGTFVDHKDDSIKITNLDCNTSVDVKTQKIKLTGVNKRVPLKEAIDTVSLPAYMGTVTISDRDSYIECDKAVFDLNLEPKEGNGRLGYKLKKNKSIKVTGTGGKPLCSIYAKLLNGNLITENSSRVKIETSALKALTVLNHSMVSADEKVKLDQLRSLSAVQSSTVNLPNVSVPALESNIAHYAHVTLAGKVAQHTINIAHYANFDGSKLKSKYVDINAAYHTQVRLWVTKMLQGVASYHARIWYKGSDQIKVGTSRDASCERDKK